MAGQASGTATHGTKGRHTDSPGDGRPTQFTPDQRSKVADFEGQRPNGADSQQKGKPYPAPGRKQINDPDRYGVC